MTARWRRLLVAGLAVFGITAFCLGHLPPFAEAEATFTQVRAEGTVTPVVIAMTSTRVPSAVEPPAGCVDLLQNGGFEQGPDNWALGDDPIPVRLVTTPARSGTYALRLGTETITGHSYSSAWQPVFLPGGYANLYLDFWTYAWTAGTPGSDHQEAVLLKPGLAVIEKVWRVLADDRDWVQHIVPVTKYQGRTVHIYFNAVTGTAGGKTGMYLDDVHLWACGPGGAPSESEQPVFAPQAVAGTQVASGVSGQIAPNATAAVITPVVEGAIPSATATPDAAGTRGVTSSSPRPAGSSLLVAGTPGARSGMWHTAWDVIREGAPSGPSLLGVSVLGSALLGLVLLLRRTE